MLRPALAGIVVLAALALALPASAAAALTEPSARVTAKSQTTISVAWTAPRDAVRYEVNLWQGGARVSVPETQTSYTLTGLRPNGQYYVWVVAFDSRGNRAVTTNSRSSPMPTGSHLPRQAICASRAHRFEGLTGLGRLERRHRHPGLPRSDQRGLALWWTGPTSVDVIGLPPASTFSFAVRAQDLGYNHSAFSAPVSATTLASATDVTPPSAPRDLFVSDNWCGEVGLQWTQATDDQDPQSAIRYRIFINGTVDPLGDARRRALDHLRRRRGQHVRAAGDRQRRQRLRAEQPVHVDLGRVLAGVDPYHGLGDADGLLGALALERDLEDDLRAPGDIGHFLDLGGGAEP